MFRTITNETYFLIAATFVQTTFSVDAISGQSTTGSTKVPEIFRPQNPNLQKNIFGVLVVSGENRDLGIPDLFRRLVSDVLDVVNLD